MYIDHSIDPSFWMLMLDRAHHHLGFVTEVTRDVSWPHPCFASISLLLVLVGSVILYLVATKRVLQVAPVDSIFIYVTLVYVFCCKLWVFFFYSGDRRLTPPFPLFTMAPSL